MKNITKSTPTRDVGWSLFDDNLDNLFEGFFRPIRRETGTVAAGGNLLPATDITENEHAFVVKADLPGIKKDDINITLEDGILTISGESKSETEQKNGDRVIRQERRYGKYVRSMQLNHQVDESQVEASYKDGVLKLVLPKKAEAKPKKISVNVN